MINRPKEAKQMKQRQKQEQEITRMKEDMPNHQTQKLGTKLYTNKKGGTNLQQNLN